MPQVNLLRSLPKTGRNIAERAASKDEETVRIAKEFDELYWDGPRKYGYGGYKDDGRWRSVAREIHQTLCKGYGTKILDVGCGKGFLVNDLVGYGHDAYGLDISKYALAHCPDEVVGRLHQGTADNLPFRSKSFDLVISINTIHNLPRDRAIEALREIRRVSRRDSFVQVASYRDEQERHNFVNWNLTAETYFDMNGWVALFDEASYTGLYDFTIIS